MLSRGIGLGLAVFAICGAARAQSGPPAPAPDAEGVAPEQHPIKVGDVIQVPRELLAEAPELKTDTAPPPPPEVPKRWYGFPILATDTVAYGMFATASLAEPTSGVTVPIGAASFVLGGPIVHAARGHWGHAGLSLLMRAGLPAAGAVLGASACTDGGGGCGQAVLGVAFVGMVAATIIDVAALSYEPTATPTASILPAANVSAEHAWLGASGTF